MLEGWPYGGKEEPHLPIGNLHASDSSQPIEVTRQTRQRVWLISVPGRDNCVHVLPLERAISNVDPDTN